MKSKTVKELRELAKARGLKGYSKLTKDELIHRLSETPAKSKKGAKPEKTIAKAGTKQPKRRSAKPPKQASPPRRKDEVREDEISQSLTSDERPSRSVETASAPVEKSIALNNTEERIEDTKYALYPTGSAPATPPGNLDEDIDRLPTLSEPVVCLLAQKPGVLHAYWILPAGEATGHGGYKLRLCHTVGDALHVHEEVPVPTDRGTWYFHVDEKSESSALVVQLGYYQNGQFISARGRSIARLPSLHASSRTDRRWWVSETDFMRMYVRAGGITISNQQYGWTASIGSPGAPFPGSSSPMTWPGNTSSR